MTTKNKVQLMMAFSSGVAVTSWLALWVTNQQDRTIDNLNRANKQLFITVQTFVKYSDARILAKVKEESEFEWIVQDF